MTRQPSRPIALLVPDMPPLEQLTAYFARVVESGQYSNFGPMVTTLESRLALTFFGAEAYPVHCVSTSSATTAIEIALQAMRLPAGSPVLLSAFGFPAAATAVARLGYAPLFAGANESTWNLSPDCAARVMARTPVAAVLPVSPFGYGEDASAWSGFAVRHGVPVIIDVAAGLGNQDVRPGTVTVFSLHATKVLGVGEGGMIATTDAELAARLRVLSNFGCANRLAVQIGANAKLSEWHAAIAHAQLDRWDQVRSRRTMVREYYRQRLGGFALAVHPQAWSVPVPAFMPIRLSSAAVAERLVTALEAAGIGARRWFFPALTEQPAFAAMPRCETAEYPLANARDLAASIICLPFHGGLTEADVERVSEVVREVVGDCASG